MSMRDNLDISAYLVLGPENTLGCPVADVVEQALDAGFTCVQIRSKVCSSTRRKRQTSSPGKARVIK